MEDPDGERTPGLRQDIMETITLSHGGGGRITRRLIETIFAPIFSNEALTPMADAAILSSSGRIAFTTDAHVVQPIFFSGGDIGSLSVNGTSNDLAVMGARPLHLSAGFILEEGLPIEDLTRIARSMRVAADLAGVSIVTGDTKVVGRGAADKIFVITSGVGEMLPGAPQGPQGIREGDAIIVSGPIGDHGATIFAEREDPALVHGLKSDCACVFPLVQAALEASPGEIRVMRDPTRGGLGMVLNEFAEHLDLSFELEEDALPIRESVRGICDMMGFDPLYLACEGRVVLVVNGAVAAAVLGALQSVPGGEEAAVVGRVTSRFKGMVYLRTRLGGTRMIDMPSGEMLPRIC